MGPCRAGGRVRRDGREGSREASSLLTGTASAVFFKMVFLGGIFMESSEATQRTPDCTCCEGDNVFSPMAPLYFPCPWRGPLEHDFF